MLHVSMHKNRNLDFLRNRENWTLTLSSPQFREDQIESQKYFFLYFFEKLWWLSLSSSAGAVMKTPLIDKIRANKKTIQPMLEIDWMRGAG